MEKAFIEIEFMESGVTQKKKKFAQIEPYKEFVSGLQVPFKVTKGLNYVMTNTNPQEPITLD